MPPSSRGRNHKEFYTCATRQDKIQRRGLFQRRERNSFVTFHNLSQTP
ncbi:hypothetical protein CGRA01v4_11316 [Colletotrichum graminicola]|nr:hypothetical protein CGRA01v4_11316 [Colletotrichum graminicola]